MTRRWTLLAGAIALSLSAPQAAFATPQQATTVVDPDPAAAALRDLKADADGAVRVTRDADGDVAFVRSADGGAMVDSDAATPRAAAKEQLADYGDAFGIDGTTSKAVVTQTLGSATGGSVVRADQVVDGVPVFGGQVVMSLDDDQGVVSVASATTDATQVPAARVSEGQARRTALTVMAKQHHVSVGGLTATAVGRRLYDPALVHQTDPAGARPVWKLEVTNGSDIRETVLVGTDRGEIALHFNDAPGVSDPAVNRRVCDNANHNLTSSDGAVPVCPVAARSEGQSSALVTDVNRAYDNLGEVSDAYFQIAGIPLTGLIGATVAADGSQALQSTVRWCYSDATCPYKNAFWDGTQMVFGQGYAAADDVVGHELTHGYVERTSGLFYLHQSGAINESVADTIGEIIDHRNGSDDDSAWNLGENIPGGAVRNMKNPPAHGQPDKMTSTLYKAHDASVDEGDVHANDGVGNKTAYLISQGGSFNGKTITGIDAGDPTLDKTGLLYLDAIPRLTSGADYAQLGDVLVSTCQQLVTAGKAGFVDADCGSVSDAVAATQLKTSPAVAGAAPRKVAAACPTGTTLALSMRDDDSQQDFGFTLGSLWHRTPAGATPSNAESGSSSLFGWDPDPLQWGDARISSAATSGFMVPTGTTTYFNFHHAYLFEFSGTEYYDGGDVTVQKRVNGTWTTVTGLPWVNGMSKSRYSSGTKIFSGDSHGYGSSQVNLSSLAGQTVRVVFRVMGDAEGSFIGWWLDDLRLYTCTYDVASAPATTVAAGTTSAKVSWTPPAYVGDSPVASYRITRSDGKVNTVGASARSITLTGLRANTNMAIAIAALTEDGDVGVARSVPVYATTNTLSSATRVTKRKAFTITAKVVRRGTRTLVAGMPVKLQRHLKGQTTWHTVSTGTTSSKGVKAWSVKQSAATYYRVVSSGVKTWLGSTSATRGVSVR